MEFLFDNTEYFVLRPDLHKASNTCTVLYSHKILISLHLSKKDYSLSLSRDSSARGPSRLDTTAKDIVDKDSEKHTKIMTGIIITLKKYKVMENGKSLLLNYASNTPSYIYFLLM